MSHRGVEIARGVRDVMRDRIYVIYLIIVKDLHLPGHKTILTVMT